MGINTKTSGFTNLTRALWEEYQVAYKLKEGDIFYLENELDVPEGSALIKDRVLYDTYSSEAIVGDILFYNHDYMTNNIPKFVLVRPMLTNDGRAKFDYETIDNIDISDIDITPVGICVLPAYFDPDGMTHFMYVNDVILQNSHPYIPSFLSFLNLTHITDYRNKLNFITTVETQNSKVGDGWHVQSIDVEVAKSPGMYRFIYEKIPLLYEDELSTYSLDIVKEYSNFLIQSPLFTSPMSWITTSNKEVKGIYSYKGDEGYSILAWPYDEIYKGDPTNFAYKSPFKDNLNGKSKYLNYNIDGYRNTASAVNLFYLITKEPHITLDESTIKSYIETDPISVAYNFKIASIPEKQQWYLPSIGELLHVGCRCMTILIALNSLLALNLGNKLSKKGEYISSSFTYCNNTNTLFSLDVEHGLIRVTTPDKISGIKVRPFIKLKF